VRAKLVVSEALGGDLKRERVVLVLRTQRQCGKRLRMGRGAFRGELERAFHPPLNERGIVLSNPHPPAPHRVQDAVHIDVMRSREESEWWVLTFGDGHARFVQGKRGDPRMRTRQPRAI
jgi:hypothetical protein